jgi:hypothetical protein
VGSGKSLNTLERRTWLDHHADEAEKVRCKISDDLVAFLERAHITEEHAGHSLFYYACGL